MSRNAQPQLALWTDGERERLLSHLPSDVYAERVLLGVLLADSRQYLPGVRASLRPEDFSVEAHRRIYSAALAVDDAGGYVDRVTVATRLRDEGKLDSVGGIGVLAELDSGVPELAHFESYVNIVRDKSLKRDIIRHASAVQQLCMAADSTAAEVLGQFEERILGVYKASVQEDTAETFTELVEACGGLDGYLRRDMSGAAQTPWRAVDALTGPWLPGQMICIAARPACGKTVVGLQVAAHIARRHEAAFFSLEMTRKHLYDRLLAAAATVPSEAIQRGRVAQDREWASRVIPAASEIANLRLRVNDRAGVSPATVRSYLLRARARKRPVHTVVIDYLQLMRGGMGRGAKRYEEISEITRNLKLMAEEYQVVMVILSQLNREVEKRPGGKPQLSDLRESGTIEQDCDKVLFLHRPELYSSDPSLAGTFNVIVAKNRQGVCGEAELVFEGDFQRVVEPERGRVAAAQNVPTMWD